jgi:hypothetical protein
MILETGKSIKIPVIFSREGVDSHNRKTTVFLECEVTVSIKNVEDYADFELILMRGHSGRIVRKDKNSPTYCEPQLKLFLKNPNEAGGSIEEIDNLNPEAHFFTPLSMKISREEVIISAKDALEKINSASVMFLAENLGKRTLETD